MAVSSRLPAPPARGLLRRSPSRVLPASLPVERPPRRLAPGVRAVSGSSGTGGSSVPRRPPAPVAPPSPASSAASSASSAIDFLTLCHRLKTTKRKGWINHSIKGPESIADHMYRMALMALIADDLPAVDRERGTFELTVKTYYPDDNQPGGAFSNFLLDLPIGESVDVCGPTGEIEYLGDGKFNIEGEEKTYSKISLVLGGSGLTPGYSLIERVLEEKDSKLEIHVIDANKTEEDILLHEKLDEAEEKSKGKIKITHVLSHPKKEDEWKKKGGLSGHVNADIIKERLFPPGNDSVVFLCGPPALIQKACLPALKDWGYVEDENCYGF